MKIEIKLPGSSATQEPQSITWWGFHHNPCGLDPSVAVEGSCSTDFPTLLVDHSIEEKTVSH